MWLIQIPFNSLSPGESLSDSPYILSISLLRWVKNQPEFMSYF